MSTPFIGEVRMFGGNFPPANWAFCNGQLINISDNTALYSLLGTTYGGNGTTTFALPDLRGRVPIAQGQGAGLTNRGIGDLGGTETVTLLDSNLPAHGHTLNASSQTATANTIGATVLPGVRATGKFYVDNIGGTPPTFGTLDANTVGPAGGSLPHDNMMPYLSVNFIICQFGVFPSRN
jgi:microcystin-dependent protein